MRLRVSVVIGASDDALPLDERLHELRRQTYQPLEVVVVLADEGQDIAELSRQHTDVKFVVPGRKGPAAGGNSGLRASSGDIVAFTGNTVPSLRWIEQIVRVYEEQGERCAAVGGSVVDDRLADRPLLFHHGVITRNGLRTDVLLEPIATCGAAGPAYPRLYHGNMSFRRAVFGQVGGFDERFDAGWEADDLCLRLVLAGFAVVQQSRNFTHVTGASGTAVRESSRRTNRGWALFRSKYAGAHFARKAIAEATRHLWRQIRPGRLWREGSLPGSAAVVVGSIVGVIEGVAAGLAARGKATLPAIGPPTHEFLPLACLSGTHVSSGNRHLSIALACRVFEDGFNGISEYTRHLAGAFARHGHRVAVFRPGAPPAAPREYEVIGVKPQHELYQAALGRTIFEYAQTRSIDVVEAPLWLGEAGGVGLLAPYPLITRLVTPADTVHRTAGLTYEKERRVASEAEQLQLATSSGVIAISEAVAKTVQEVFGVPLAHASRRMAVIPLGLPDAGHVPISPCELPEGGGPVLLYLGRLHERKGVLELGKAFSRVAIQCPTARLWVAGKDFSNIDGYFAKTGLNYIESLRAGWDPAVSQRAYFFGAVTDAEKNFLISQCDVVVVPSRYESFGLVLLEAMRFGKPVVASAVGGMREIVAPGQTGLLVPAESPPALAEALLELLDNPNKRQTMGEQGLARFHERYELEKCVERTLAFYHEVREYF